MTIIVIAAVVALIAVFIAGNNASTATSSSQVTGVSTVNAELQGIPQSGTTLGNSNAPITLTAYEDLKCPICQEFNLNIFPSLVSQYVKSGEMKVTYVPQTFVGQAEAPGDSAHAARFALAAGEQNKFWYFAELMYHNQQNEDTTYVTTSFLKNLGSKISGLNVNEALDQANSSNFTQELSAASSQFTSAGFTGTPSFQLSKNGSSPTALKWTQLTLTQFTGPINQLLQQ